MDKFLNVLAALPLANLKLGGMSVELTMLALACVFADAGIFAFAGLAAGVLHAAWLIVTLDPDDTENCLRRFRANSTTGWIVFAGLVADAVLRF